MPLQQDFCGNAYVDPHMDLGHGDIHVIGAERGGQEGFNTPDIISGCFPPWLAIVHQGGVPSLLRRSVTPCFGIVYHPLSLRIMSVCCFISMLVRSIVLWPLIFYETILDIYES